MGWFIDLFKTREEKLSFPNAQDNTPFGIISCCMEDIYNDLRKNFNNEWYKWSEENGKRKFFECLILTRFLMDYAFLTKFSEKMDKASVKFYLTMFDSILKGILKTSNSKIDFSVISDVINDKLMIYSSIMENKPHPECWLLLAGECTGTDYVSQENCVGQIVSPLTFSNLINYAQKCLGIAIDLKDQIDAIGRKTDYSGK